jgi:hypothetical protein
MDDTCPTSRASMFGGGREESVSREETFADLTFIFRAMFYHPDLGVIAPEAQASVA